MTVGAYLGFLPSEDEHLFAEHESAALLLGPPRSYKTAASVIPTVLSAGRVALVVTSTKTDVLRATVEARQNHGRVWCFDPSGSDGPVEGTTALRWSPVVGAGDWDTALRTTRAMVSVTNTGAGGGDDHHWAARARALLAPCLHAAALAGLDIFTVADWVLAHDHDAPLALLGGQGAARASAMLGGVARTGARERASIFSTAADTLELYASTGAASAASSPNFDAETFVRSSDTVFVSSPAHHQEQAAPLVVGLLSALRHAAYAASRADPRPAARLTVVLDEAANIAPVHDLAAMVSEAGGQGVHVMACFQDLSQVRVRWGAEAATGFLSLFGTKLVLGGILDPGTTTALATASGESPVWVPSTQHGSGAGGPSTSEGTIRQWRPNLTPGDITGIPPMHGLCIRGTRWDLLELVPYWEGDGDG